MKVKEGGREREIKNEREATEVREKEKERSNKKRERVWERGCEREGVRERL
jgi:hypothetical protein